MIWYEISPALVIIMFVIFSLTAALQGVIVLEAGELIREKRALNYFRAFYTIQAMVSAVLLAETLLAIASIEGGLFLEISASPRYLAVLPVLLFPHESKYSMGLPAPLRLVGAGYFLPLLRLPQADMLPLPLSVGIVVFGAIWFALDAVAMLLSFRAYARTEITRSVMPHIIRTSNNGICVANGRGWILEGNPAFYGFCQRLGIEKPQRIEEFEGALEELGLTGGLDISHLGNGRSIGSPSGVYFLQSSSFKVGWRKYVQLALSDVTKITAKARELDRENEKLIHKNRELEEAISVIAQEEVAREREKLCRAAHDSWSQRLAVAGMAVDMLSSQEEIGVYSQLLEKIAANLEAPNLEPAMSGNLSDVLQTLLGMYRKLGVEIIVGGKADFSQRQQEALSAVLREALVNAVRHAYSRQVTVTFSGGDKGAGVAIENACLDSEPGLTEGRGLYDMKSRVQEAGGSIHFEKGNSFRIEISFNKERVELTGGVCL